MCVEIPDVRVGEPSTCGNAAVFPLFAGLPLDRSLDYLLASEAMAAGTLSVREVSEEGSVGELLAENVGDRHVLFLEGDEMKGGKQNRVLASTVLVAGTSRTRIPVACTEPGRWEYDSRQFSGGSRCPPSLRHLLKQEANGRQSRIWATIRRQHCRLGIRSRTEDMSDAMEARRDAAADLRRDLPYAEGASGIAVALGGKVVGIDIFDKAATLERLWDRLLQGIALDALADTGCRAIGSDVAVRLYVLRSVRWHQADPVGLGESYRAQDDGTLATALVMDGTLVHLGMSMPVVQ
jgi:hypothetical protein